MNKRLKVFLITLVLVITTGIFFGVLYSFGLAIFYEDSRTAVIHGMIAGLASTTILAIYLFVSGIVRKIIENYLNSSDIDEY